ncbi:MAG: hypothetical protein ACI4UE_02890 [Candidatus Scatovivens sp.]
MNRKIKKNKNRIKILILICILIVLILFIILKWIEINKNKPKSNNEIINEQVENYLSDKLCPRNISNLYSNYKGKNDKNDLYRNLKIFVNGLPEFTNKIREKNEEELIPFFKNNNKYIYEYLGIEEQEDFIKISKYLQENDVTNMEFDYCEIYEDSYKLENEEYLTFNMKFVYKEKTIRLKIFFSMLKGIEPQVIYKATN